MATNRWRTTIDNATYLVEARASWRTGGVRVLVDGAEMRRGGDSRDKTQRIIFPLGHHVATLVWMTVGRATHYDLVIDGRSVSTGGQPRPPANPYESLAMSWLLLIALVGFLVGVLWFAALPEIRLAREGREVAARVTGGHISSGRSTNYYLRYDFVTANGDVRRVEGRVSYDTYRSTRTGDVITVVYVPSAPDIQRPASFDERIWLVALVAMFGGMVPFAAAMVWRAHRLRSITAALADRAVRTAAKVEKVAKERLGQGARRIAYSYDDMEGRAHKGRSPKLYAEEAAAYAPGSNATIAYDPNNAGNSMWLGATDSNATVWVAGAR